MNQWKFVLVGVYLLLMSVWDIRKKEIPMIPGILCGIAVTGLQLVERNSLTSWLPGVAVALFLLAVGKLSRGGVGDGDALVYLVTGLCLGLADNLAVLVISLFLASLTALVLLVFCHVGKKYEMAFIPFTTVAFGLVVLL